MAYPKRVFVCGVGMTKFEKPGARPDFDYPVMVKESVVQALRDANLLYSDVQQAVAGYCYGESTCGQRALYELGMTGIPVYNVNNNCATGSSALLLGKHLIEGGIADCVLAVGFEKMERGSLGLKWPDRTVPVDQHVEVLNEVYGMTAAPVTSQIFGAAGREHMEKYGTRPEHFAKIAWKNHKHSVDNPLSQFRDEYTLEQIMNSNPVYGPLSKLQCCPTSDGGAAAILCSEDFVVARGLRDKAIEILAMEMATDFPSTLTEKSMIKVAGYDVTKAAAQRAFRKADLTPSDVNVIELHDCFSTNELITYEALGLCPEGRAGELIDRGDNTYGGKFVINPSGGLISKGHPLGATGLAQCYELCRQLRGECGKRQVPMAKIGLQHNLGLGGACVVALYKKALAPSPKVAVKFTAMVTSLESSFKSDSLFSEMENDLKAEGADLVDKYKAIYCFELSGNAGTGYWYVDLKTAPPSVSRGKQDLKADCTMKLSDEDCYSMMTGTLNSQTAFLQGRLKIQGNMGLAMKLQNLLPARKTAKKVSVTTVSVAEPLESSFKSDVVFKEVEDRLKQEGESMVSKFKAVYLFELTGSGGVGYWYVDAKNGAGAVYRGKQADIKPDCTLKMTDEDCFQMMTGALNAQTAFLKGKVKIQGNMGLAMKLQALQSARLKSKM